MEIPPRHTLPMRSVTSALSIPSRHPSHGGSLADEGGFPGKRKNIFGQVMKISEMQAEGGGRWFDGSLAAGAYQHFHGFSGLAR